MLFLGIQQIAALKSVKFLTQEAGNEPRWSIYHPHMLMEEFAFTIVKKM